MQKYFIRFLLAFTAFSFAQEAPITRTTSIDSMRHTWRAYWITHPTESGFDYGVYCFRRTFQLETVPDSLIVHVSADNRYRLFVNNKAVGEGPARDDLFHWPYETINLAPHLKIGKNVIAAQVVNYGEFKSGGQFSEQTAFILQAENLPELDSNSAWRVKKNHGVAANPITPETFPQYYPVLGFYAGGPCDSLYAENYPWGWDQIDFNDSQWPNARLIRKGAGRGFPFGHSWFLTPRRIKMMEEIPQRIASIERTTFKDADFSFLAGEKKLLIPAHSTISILCDNKVLTMGYPELTFSGGAGSTIKITYAESLYDKKFLKGDRNETKDKSIYGVFDVIKPDGGEKRLFRPTWVRAFRYVQLDIITTENVLTLDNFAYVFAAYPLLEKATFTSNDSSLGKIWEAAWRSLRLCARETYFSDAYFEQMQYIGDTRVQALATMIISGDESLFRNALRQFDASRLPNGLTQSRYPAREQQIIPTYSLLYIAMLHDYMMYRGDADYLRQFLPGVESILTWFEEHLDENGLLGRLDWWNFCDWAPEFFVGIPPGADQGGSTLVTLTFVYGLQKAAELFEFCGDRSSASRYYAMAKTIQAVVRDFSFDKSRGLYAETPAHQQFSQHSNIFAVLTDTHPKEEQAELMTKVISDTTLIQTTFYFKFYLFEALARSGLGDAFIQQLDPWRKFIKLGLSTFPEDDSDRPRSDCHPWSASPCYYLLYLTGGIRPAAPGFGSVLISPCFGDLSEIHVVYPHPQGEINVDLIKTATGVTGEITLPQNVTGVFQWSSLPINLSPGAQKIKID